MSGNEEKSHTSTQSEKRPFLGELVCARARAAARAAPPRAPRGARPLGRAAFGTVFLNAFVF